MSRAYKFPRQLFCRLKRAAAKSDLYELCYLLFGKGTTVERMIRIPNKLDDILCHQIDWKARDRIRHRKLVSGLQFLGYLHTHPVSRAIPSDGDILGYPPGSLIFIYADVYEELRAYRMAPGPQGVVENRVIIE